MSSALTLDKAVLQKRQHEEINKQQSVVWETKTKHQKETKLFLLEFKKRPIEAVSFQSTKKDANLDTTKNTCTP